MYVQLCFLGIACLREKEPYPCQYEYCLCIFRNIKHKIQNDAIWLNFSQKKRQ
jgi:hypothetical protein